MEVALSAVSLLPSAIAIIVALATRQVFIAMFAGIWAGAWIIEGPTFGNLLTSWLHVVDTYLLEAIAPKDGKGHHFAIVLFSLITGGMIGVITKNGGSAGIVRALSGWANTPKRTQAATVGLGGLIFFDDYANTMIVGNTMRPLTDANRISREKLAFLVDSTAAPIACIALVTTWVGFQVSLLNDALASDALADTPLDTTGFELMMGSIAYSFYPILMLVFIIFLIASGKDFGPMRKAERAARKAEPSAPAKTATQDASEEFMPHDVKPLAANALLPILCFIAATIIGLIDTGSSAIVASYTADVPTPPMTIRDILGNADPYISVLWGSLTGLSCAIIMSIATKRLSVTAAMHAMEEGLQPMLIAAMILTFAWAIAAVNGELKTAEYIVSLTGDSISPQWLPVIIFCIAGATSFATGSSWSTMGILVPLIIPLCLASLDQSATSNIAHHPILLACVASVLTGSVWGDHCSPISDTTILSSMASGCHHIDHVRTQTPYAITVAAIGMICGLLPVGFGLPWYVGMGLGVIATYAILHLLGTTTECDNRLQH